MSPLGCPKKWYPFIYSQSLTFELLGLQKLEHVMKAHPIPQQQPGLKSKPPDDQTSVLTS